jgi:hypothetical protein
MAAGQGFKTFVTGEVLTAGDVNGYLMQGINVFTNATARDAAILTPAEGQFAFTKDNNSLWYYDGAAWVASGATGDIEGVTAGVGISGGGTSGTVTITNSMATAIDAKGDLVPGTGADTFDRLAVGANDTVLTADSSTATGLKWATPASGSMTLLSTTTLSGTSTVISSINQSYKDLIFIGYGITWSANSQFQLRPNSTQDISQNVGAFYASGSASVYKFARILPYTDDTFASNANNAFCVTINNYTSTSYKPFAYYGNNATATNLSNSAGTITAASAITSMQFTTNAGTASFTAGTILTYGVN